MQNAENCTLCKGGLHGAVKDGASYSIVLYKKYIRYITCNFKKPLRPVFPFYTLGRFQNTPCTGTNQLEGTCVLGGQCSDNGGIATGSCSPLTNQAVCCICGYTKNRRKHREHNKQHNNNRNRRTADQSTCGTTTSFNNTYFVNPGYPGSWTGGSACTLTINPIDADVCQLRITFLDLALATPNGDGVCNTDVLTVTGGASLVPPLCGENSNQHVYVDFAGNASIQISVSATPSFTLGRHWHIRVTQIGCNSAGRGQWDGQI